MDEKFERDLEYSDHEGQKCYIMYHGTTVNAAQGIKSQGFRRSVDGMLGPGVYVSRSIEKARRYPLNPKRGERLAILKLKVRVGKVKKIDRQGHPMQKTWHEHGYDTAWVPPNCGMVGSGLEEDCVWDPDRIEVLDIMEITMTNQIRAALLNMMATPSNAMTNQGRAALLNMMATPSNAMTNPGTVALLNMMATPSNVMTNPGPAALLNMMATPSVTMTSPGTSSLLNMTATPSNLTANLRTAALLNMMATRARR